MLMVWKSHSSCPVASPKIFTSHHGKFLAVWNRLSDVKQTNISNAQWGWKHFIAPNRLSGVLLSVYSRSCLCVKEGVFFDFGLYLNTNTLYGFSCWVHHSREWANKPEPRSVTAACAVIRVAGRSSRSWTGAQFVEADVLCMWEAASCALLSHWRDLWISGFDSASALSVRQSSSYYYLCQAHNLWGWTRPSHALLSISI